MLTVRVRSCGKVQLGPWLGSKWTLDTDRGCNWGCDEYLQTPAKSGSPQVVLWHRRASLWGPHTLGRAEVSHAKLKTKPAWRAGAWGRAAAPSLSRLRGNSSSVPAQSQSHQYHQCTPACTKVTCLKAAIHHQLLQEQHIWLCLYQRLSEEYGLILPPKSVTMRWPLVGNFLDLSRLPNLYMRSSWLTVQRAWGINRHAAELNSQFN